MEAKVITVPNKPIPIDLAGDLSLIPGLERSLGEGNGYPLQYSCLEHSMGRGAWRATIHRVTKSQTRLSMHTCIESYKVNTVFHSNHKKLRQNNLRSWQLTSNRTRSEHRQDSSLPHSVASVLLVL